MERDVDVIELGTASDLTKGGMGPLDEEVLVMNVGAGISAD